MGKQADQNKTSDSDSLERRVICSHADEEKCPAKCEHLKAHAGIICDFEEHAIYDCEELGMCKTMKVEVWCKSI